MAASAALVLVCAFLVDLTDLDDLLDLTDLADLLDCADVLLRRRFATGSPDVGDGGVWAENGSAVSPSSLLHTGIMQHEHSVPWLMQQVSVRAFG